MNTKITFSKLFKVSMLVFVLFLALFSALSYENEEKNANTFKENN